MLLQKTRLDLQYEREACATERRLREECERELEGARAEVHALLETIRLKDALAPLCWLCWRRPGANARAANAWTRAPLDHHAWRLGSKLVVEQHQQAAPPLLTAHDAADPEDRLAGWLAHGGTDAVCSVVAKAMCKLVEVIGKHPGLLSNGFFEDGVVAATTEAALAAADRESQHIKHQSGRPLDVIKAALDGAAVHVAASHGLSGSEISTAVPSSHEQSDAQMEELFQYVQAFDANRDGYIDEAEMKLYLVAVGAWETEDVYTDTKWPRAWPGICTIMTAGSTKGLPLESFKLYHEKYRKGKLAHDLNQLSFGISNAGPREWWRTYIGERRSVRVQLAIDAFAVWMEKQGLPDPEAQIFGALAAYGINTGEDGDITTTEFDEFTQGFAGEFTVSAVRAREVLRDGEDAGSVEEFALYLGIDPATEPQLMWIAEHCRVAPLPANWVEYFTGEGDSYFYNAGCNTTVWHHPLDLFFKQLVQERRGYGKLYQPGITYKT